MGLNTTYISSGVLLSYESPIGLINFLYNSSKLIITGSYDPWVPGKKPCIMRECYNDYRPYRQCIPYVETEAMVTLRSKCVINNPLHPLYPN